MVAGSISVQNHKFVNWVEWIRRMGRKKLITFGFVPMKMDALTILVFKII